MTQMWLWEARLNRLPNWDEYDGMVIRAANVEMAREILKTLLAQPGRHARQEADEFTISSLLLSGKPRVILASFNVG